MENILIAKTRDDARIPSKRHEDAGYDVYGCFDEDVLVILPNNTVSIPTGIITAFSSDLYAQIEERGSTGSRGMSVRAGVFDSGYRGEWFIMITNVNDKPLVISRLPESSIDIDDFVYYSASKAIAQFVMLPVPKTNIMETTVEDILKIESERGEGRVGSSGK